MEDALLKIYEFANVLKELLNRSPINSLVAEILHKNKFAFFLRKLQAPQLNKYIQAIDEEMTTLKKWDTKIQTYFNEIDLSEENYHKFLKQLLAQTNAVQQSNALLSMQVQNSNGNLKALQEALQRNQAIRQEALDNVKTLYHLSRMQYKRLFSTID
ncbi:hypothetical protein FACS1894182_00090 [Bacteroidia bacterium]|nr:hypothetical protein FACS1894182_00090 [Bacteroidia bacterium]